jgi:hypothetical protein
MRLARDCLTDPPARSYERVAGLARRVFGLLQRGHQRIGQTRDLYVIAGKVCAVLSWMSSDLGRLATAEAHSRNGWILADEVDHDGLRALLLCTQSKNAFWARRYNEAAAHARRGYECMPPGTASVLLACQEADALQAQGRIDNAREALIRAERARESISRADELGGFFACGIARQANYSIATCLQSGSVKEALLQVERAETAWHGGEQWAYGTWAQVQIGASIAHVMNGEMDGAAAVLQPVLNQPAERHLATGDNAAGRRGGLAAGKAEDRAEQGRRSAACADHRLLRNATSSPDAASRRESMSESNSPERMRDHWWRRPGWPTGRSMYTWHVTFDGQPELHELVRSYQTALAPLPGLDLIPLRWLHLTMQGIAFTDEVTPQEIADIAEAARKRLATQQPVPLSVGPAFVDPEAILLQVSPAGALDLVRAGVRGAIADVLGAARVPEAEYWTPHISVAYSNSDGPAFPYAEALNTTRRVPADMIVSAVQLIELSRDAHLYQWTTKAKVALSG